MNNHNIVASPLSYSKTWFNAHYKTVIFCLICDDLAFVHLPSLFPITTQYTTSDPHSSHSSCSHLLHLFLLLFFIGTIFTIWNPYSFHPSHLLGLSPMKLSLSSSAYIESTFQNLLLSLKLVLHVLWGNCSLIQICYIWPYSLTANSCFILLYYSQWPVTKYMLIKYVLSREVAHDPQLFVAPCMDPWGSGCTDCWSFVPWGLAPLLGFGSKECQLLLRNFT